MLPKSPSYQQACDIIDNREDEYWLPTLKNISERHNIDLTNFTRIWQGANALFKLNQDSIIKIVPPNWQYQAQAELAATQIVTNKLTIATPKIFHSGEVNGWMYLIMQYLPGQCLADIWPRLGFSDKSSLITQVAHFAKQLHHLKLPRDSDLHTNWKAYHQQLIKDCVSRHQRKKLCANLVAQIPEYLAQCTNYFDDGNRFLIHMDLNPWNLMAEKSANQWKLTGVLDFGDAIIGRSKLLELATPIIFMCQGDPKLVEVLLENYQLFLQDYSRVKLKQDLMAVALLRPACDFNFVLKQVPVNGPRENWQQIASQLFPV